VSALPKAVQAQLDAAAAIEAEMAAASAPEQGNPEPVVEVQEAPVQPEPTEVQETQVAHTAPEVDWEQRFKVIEGKYRAEIPRLSDENRELRARFDEAVKALEDANKPKPQESKLVTDADVEAFGSDLVDMVRRASREEFETLSRKFSAELEARFGAVTEKVQRTEQAVAKTAEDKFWEKVLSEHADFDVVNNDPHWFEFLDTRIPGSRFTRRALATDAIEARDAVALNEQLKAFKDTYAVPVAKPTKPKPNLNSQVAPNTSSVSSPSADPTGRIWSAQEYQAALDHRNLQRMSREDYDALVAEADTAYAEGRVRF